MAPQPRSSDSNISYERAATLQDLKEMAMIDAAAQTPSPDLPRLARSFAQPAQKRGVGFGFESLEAEMQAYKLDMDDEIRNRNHNIDRDNKEAKEKFVVFKDEDEQPPAPRSPPSTLFPLSTPSTPQPNESSSAPSTIYSASLPIDTAVLSQLALISRERADLLARLQALHEQEQDLLKAYVDAASVPSPSTSEAQSHTQASPPTIPSPSNLSPQPCTQPSTSVTPSIRARAAREPLAMLTRPKLDEDEISKPSMSSTKPRLPSHSTPSHVSTAKEPSSYQRPTRTSAKHMSLRKDTTKQRTAPKALSQPRSPLCLVPTPYKKNMASKLHTSKVEPREKRDLTSLVSIEREEVGIFRDAGASVAVGGDTTASKLGATARKQDKGNEVKTPGTRRVETQGVTKGRTPATSTTAGKKGNVKNTPGTNRVSTLESAMSIPQSRIPTSTRKLVSKGVKTPGRDNAATEWNVPATVARKKWDF